MAGSTQKQAQNKNKKGGKIAAICIVILIIILAIVLYFLLNDKREVVVNEDNLDKVLTQMEEQEITPPGSYTVRMNYTWHFANGTATSKDAYVENAESNTNSVYFDVTLANTDETIYESPIIPVGKHVDGIKLSKDLDPGTYECVVTYHMLDENDESTSTVNVKLSIVIAK